MELKHAMIAGLAVCGVGIAGAAVRFRQGEAVRPVAVTQMKLPAQVSKGKGWVSDFTADGTGVKGQFYSETGLRGWTWSAAKGFKIGKIVPKNQDSNQIRWETGHKPGTIKTWNEEYGWETTATGRKVGAHNGFGLQAEEMSADGSVVVGGYSCDTTGSPDAQDGTFQEVDGKDISYFWRSFVWSKKTGLQDLGDFISTVKKVNPVWKGTHYSCAVSRGGGKIVLVADQLFVAALPPGF